MTKVTTGEQRVRVAFNPSEISEVAQIKQRTAELINLVADMPKPEDPDERAEFSRLVALALTSYEQAAMWAVKAATTGL